MVKIGQFVAACAALAAVGVAQAAQLPREYPWGTCDVQSNILTLTVSPTWNRRTVEIAGLRTAVRNVDEWYDMRHGDIVSVRLLKETHGQPRVITVTLADAPAYDPKPVMANGLLFLDAANAVRTEKGRLVWKARFPESGRFNVSLRRPSPAGAKVSLAIDGATVVPGEVVIAKPGEKEIVLESSVPSPSLGLCFDEYELAEAKVSVDFRKTAGPMKPLHGVNNAPRRVPAGSKQPELKAAGIPYSRLHDTAGMFGGTHYVDIPNVFPNFEADENDPGNYDFTFTDAFLKPIVEAGCQPFYRLGVTIENYWRVKDYRIAPPKDFAKWARICEHVVRHYNEGWANGFRWNIVYWEIWNEPENPAMWKGTRAQYYELYRVAANHLKRRFPRLKVGGYGSCGFYSVDDPAMRTDRLFSTFVPWFEDFLAYVKDPKTAAPLDFYSWHLYVAGDWSVERIATHADYVRRTLDAAGFAKTESIFNEWNIFEGWAHGGFDAIKEPPIAARVAAAFALMQAGTIDKAMYYDAQPNGHYCGLFYFPSERTTPVYEAFRAFNMLYTLGTAVESAAPDRGLAVVAAKGGSDRAILLANMANDSVKLRPAVAGAEGAVFRLYRVDPQHRGLDEDGTWKPGEELTVPKDGFVLLSTRDAKVVQAKGHALEHALNGIDTSDGAPEQAPAATDVKDGNGPKESGTTFVRDALRKYVDSGELPGMISVLYKDGVQETCCIGYADVAAKRPMTM